MKNKYLTTNTYILGALVFAILQTLSVLHLDGLTIFFSAMAIISYLKDKRPY